MNDITGPFNLSEGLVGAQAAVQAVNEAGGIKDPAGGSNRPLELVDCDSRGDANAAAACARDMVDQEVLAVVGGSSVQGGSFLPVMYEAGIPSFGTVLSGTAESTDPNSYPFGSSLHRFFTTIAAAKQAGETSITFVYATPNIVPLLEVFKTAATAMGLETNEGVFIDPSVADFSAPAAQAAGQDGAMIALIGGPDIVKFAKALVQQGVDLKERPLMTPSNNLGTPVLEQLGDDGTGIWGIGYAYPVTFTSNPGVKRYNDELDAFGDTDTVRNENGFTSWVAIHVIADALNKVDSIDTASLLAELKDTGEITYDGYAPIDLSAKAQFEGKAGELMNPTNVYVRAAMISRVKDGELVPVVEDFVRFDEAFEILPL